MVLLGIHWEQIDLLDYIVVNCVLFNRTLLACVNVAEKIHQCMTVVLSANKATSNVGLVTTLPLHLFLDDCLLIF